MQPSHSLILLALAAAQVRSSPVISPSSYKLATSFSGSSFFDGFTAYTGHDPTHGFIQYIGLQPGVDAGLIGLIHNATSASDLIYIGVDTSGQAPSGRRSMRLESKYEISKGSIVVADVHHMPTGCGTWPAFWLLGNGSWPSTGEVDIIEAVNEDNYNHVTLHTSAGFKVKDDPKLFRGQLHSPDCNDKNATNGCSVSLPPMCDNMATAGKAFNQQSGGVYATVWDQRGITVYLFPHDDQPADLVAGNPKPSGWNTRSMVQFQASQDSFDKHFQSLRMIVNTDLCGDWAGSPKSWGETCAKSTGVQTCSEYVEKNPEAFKEAFWLFDSIKVYTSS